MSDVDKYMLASEFINEGFLQEVNRLFFHPRGLALGLSVTESPGARSFEFLIWDCRDDPEGVVFGEGIIDQGKIDRVRAELDKHIEARTQLLGSHIQGPFTYDLEEKQDG